MSAQEKPLNLLPKTVLEQSVWGRSLRWALSTGRYVIIITEIVVIAAFLSRFKLDQDVSDLGERINGKKNVMEVMLPVETKFRQVQNKLALARSTKSESIKFEEIFGDLESSIPEGISLQTMKIEKNLLHLTALAKSEGDLADFLNRGGMNNRWKTIELENISGNAQQGVSFSMKIWL
ncbi:MAG: type IV pilus assembly protein PilN [Microgenomates group bacterium Gr01-1014_16]|nr:MAG: type IV pilus assembly protein PilN [Microgenomates group bacterium Gr01-1014_16]